MLLFVFHLKLDVKWAASKCYCLYLSYNDKGLITIHRFCATGTMGIIGDLTSGEIIEQLVHANSITRIRNVVFMGMGEPL